MIYFYISEIFGSISTVYIEDSKFSINFGITLLIFTFLAILAGYYHGFIAGFVGELLYQLAYYDNIYIEWCFFVAIWGLICGLYKYKPLRYQEKIKIVYTAILLFINSVTSILLLTLVQIYYYQINENLTYIIINHGLKFFIQALLTVVFIIPLLIVLYDKGLATREAHLYYIILTHHPISMSDHSFYLKLGTTYIYFCSRCSGVIIGGMLTFFFIRLLERINNITISPELAVILCIVLPIPGLIDWGTQRMLLRTSTTESRLFTGFIIGNALHFMSLTNKYYFFMIFLLILYFGILGLLMYFGHKKEMKQLKAENNNNYSNNIL